MFYVIPEVSVHLVRRPTRRLRVSPDREFVSASTFRNAFRFYLFGFAARSQMRCASRQTSLKFVVLFDRGGGLRGFISCLSSDFTLVAKQHGLNPAR